MRGLIQFWIAVCTECEDESDRIWNTSLVDETLRGSGWTYSQSDKKWTCPTCLAKRSTADEEVKP